MPHRGENSNHINDKDRDHPELTRNNLERLIRMVCNRKSIQSGNHSESEIQDVERYEEEENDAGHSLNRIKPVSRIRISEIIWSRLGSDHQSVHCVVNQRDENAADFDEQNVRD